MMKQLAFFLALASSASAIELTPENWDEHTSDKSVFLKFYAPCKFTCTDSFAKASISAHSHNHAK
jgi:hypothetical protein